MCFTFAPVASLWQLQSVMLPHVDKSWTLFLDRDGVINHEKADDYIRNWDEFRFYDNVREALSKLSDSFGTIVMVTNQRGIGRGLMTEADLHAIHSNMLTAIVEANGRVDKVYYCTAVDSAHSHRKPNPGMAHEAKKDFEHIDFSKSIMVGNKLSDMQFGRNAGMLTVYVDTTHPDVPSPHPLIDFRFKDLHAFSEAVATVSTKA